MIRENQALLNRLNVLTDALAVFCAFLLGFAIRFYILPDGVQTVAFRDYVIAGGVMAVVHVVTFTMLGMYEGDRKKHLHQEIGNVFMVCLSDMALLMMGLFIIKSVHFARLALAAFFVTAVLLLSVKRIVVTEMLRSARARGLNVKSIMIVGSGREAKACLEEITRTPELGYQVVGYVSSHDEWDALKYLGNYEALDAQLEAIKPDEVIAGLRPDEYESVPRIINACERNGIKMSLIPFYVRYMPSRPQFDYLNSIPLLNLRRIPLDNLGNAFIKRAVDIAGSLVLIVLTSPLMLVTAIGVRLSSPGPIIFSQERVGLNQKPFRMYKFRSMAVNSESDTAWSRNEDDRKTRFGALIRKYSIDELPQFFNVLKGDMSLVGPRPEIPHHVEHFKEEIPLYMVKHQVKPGMTGWAQVHGLRGDTSVEERVKCDIWYIENWSFWLDLKIMALTLVNLRNRENTGMSGDAEQTASAESLPAPAEAATAEAAEEVATVVEVAEEAAPVETETAEAQETDTEKASEPTEADAQNTEAAAEAQSAEACTEPEAPEAEADATCAVAEEPSDGDDEKQPPEADEAGDMPAGPESAGG